MLAYLKKKKMYELLREISRTKLSSMKNATYKFYQGTEWLECSADNGESRVVYKMYHEGNLISLDILKWNDEVCEYKQIDRMMYYLQNDENRIKTYQRTETYQEVEETNRWLKTLAGKHVESQQVCYGILI